MLSLCLELMAPLCSWHRNADQQSNDIGQTATCIFSKRSGAGERSKEVALPVTSDKIPHPLIALNCSYFLKWCFPPCCSWEHGSQMCFAQVTEPEYKLTFRVHALSLPCQLLPRKDAWASCDTVNFQESRHPNRENDCLWIWRPLCVLSSEMDCSENRPYVI